MYDTIGIYAAQNLFSCMQLKKSKEIFRKKTRHEHQLAGGWPVHYFQSVTEDGWTWNLASDWVGDWNPCPADYKASALNHLPTLPPSKQIKKKKRILTDAGGIALSESETLKIYTIKKQSVSNVKEQCSFGRFDII